jgi:hypothetical protein
MDIYGKLLVEYCQAEGQRNKRAGESTARLKANQAIIEEVG